MIFKALVKEFWEENRKDVSYNFSITFDIIASLFKGIKDEIASGEFNDIRITYLGSFVFNKYINIRVIHSNINRYKKGLLDSKTFEDYTLNGLRHMLRNRNVYMGLYRDMYLEIIQFFKQYRDDKNS